jgi:hypothetical protein
VPTTRHVYPILRKYAEGGSLEFLQERVLLDVATSTDLRIDADCYNCLLRVRKHTVACLIVPVRWQVAQRCITHRAPSCVSELRAACAGIHR